MRARSTPAGRTRAAGATVAARARFPHARRADLSLARADESSGLVFVGEGVELREALLESGDVEVAHKVQHDDCLKA